MWPATWWAITAVVAALTLAPPATRAGLVPWILVLPLLPAGLFRHR